MIDFDVIYIGHVEDKMRPGCHNRAGSGLCIYRVMEYGQHSISMQNRIIRFYHVSTVSKPMHSEVYNLLTVLVTATLKQVMCFWSINGCWSGELFYV